MNRNDLIYKKKYLKYKQKYLRLQQLLQYGGARNFYHDYIDHYILNIPTIMDIIRHISAPDDLFVYLSQNITNLSLDIDNINSGNFNASENDQYSVNIKHILMEHTPIDRPSLDQLTILFKDYLIVLSEQSLSFDAAVKFANDLYIIFIGYILGIIYTIITNKPHKEILYNQIIRLIANNIYKGDFKNITPIIFGKMICKLDDRQLKEFINQIFIDNIEDDELNISTYQKNAFNRLLRQFIREDLLQQQLGLLMTSGKKKVIRDELDNYERSKEDKLKRLTDLQEIINTIAKSKANLITIIRWLYFADKLRNIVYPKSFIVFGKTAKRSAMKTRLHSYIYNYTIILNELNIIDIDINGHGDNILTDNNTIIDKLIEQINTRDINIEQIKYLRQSDNISGLKEELKNTISDMREKYTTVEKKNYDNIPDELIITPPKIKHIEPQSREVSPHDIRMATLARANISPSPTPQTLSSSSSLSPISMPQRSSTPPPTQSYRSTLEVLHPHDSITHPRRMSGDNTALIGRHRPIAIKHDAKTNSEVLEQDYTRVEKLIDTIRKEQELISAKN